MDDKSTKFKKQIGLNFSIEQIIDSYKFESYKLRRNIDNLENKKRLYKNKIKKVEKGTSFSGSLKQRFDLYVSTCSRMIESLEQQIEEMKNFQKSDFERLKLDIKEIFFDALINESLLDETLIEDADGKHYYYSLPSAKLIFKKQEIIINDESIFQKFLDDNNLEINKEKLEISFAIAEDSSIIHTETGLIAHGLCVENDNIDIKFI
jgi:hypothetical protein